MHPDTDDLIEFFLNNTNLTFLYKTDHGDFNHQKMKFSPAGIKLTTTTISGLELLQVFKKVSPQNLDEMKSSTYYVPVDKVIQFWLDLDSTILQTTHIVNM